ncbi:unnamed protein product [Candidula unifasciata]|uniref:START domain-containing protein n=1 Tax=Candidula unifasciata TaxID=100452 RepID=A0A8S3YQG3_9EUPU|nr:unnamed protein product [Candidula unifasciata]
MPSNVELREIATNAATLLQGYMDDSDGWHTAKKTVRYYYGYRGQSEYNCSKEIIFKYIDPNEGEECLRVKWDKDIKNLKLLKQIDPDLRIMISSTNSAAKGLIAPRDFVDVILTLKTETCISTNGVSIETDEYPPDGKFVRGFNHPCGMKCLSHPDQTNHTRLVTFIQTDIKGLLPRSLVDAAIPSSMAGFFNNLRAILKKDGHLSA